MENINYNIYEIISRLVLEDKGIIEISQELNLEKSFVVTILKKARNEYILSFDEKKYYLVSKIDELLNRKKKRKIINNFGGKKDIIFKLICDGKSSAEICDILGISIEGYKVLRDNTLVKRKSGEVNIIPSIMRLRGLNEEVILTNSPVSSLETIDCSDTFKFIVISDLHAGSRFENLDYVKKVYDEASKLGIKDIFISGDFIEGCHCNYSRCPSKYSSTISQVMHMLNDYPFDNSITNHILLGNHEAFPIIVEEYDMFMDLKRRNDFKVSGYRSGYYKIKSEYISLKHEINRVINEINDNVVLFNFLGHSHQYKCNYDGKYVTFRVPTCSDLEGDTKESIVNKGYLICEVHFDSIGKANNLSVIYKDFENVDTEIKFERRLVK